MIIEFIIVALIIIKAAKVVKRKTVSHKKVRTEVSGIIINSKKGMKLMLKTLK